MSPVDTAGRMRALCGQVGFDLDRAKPSVIERMQLLAAHSETVLDSARMIARAWDIFRLYNDLGADYWSLATPTPLDSSDVQSAMLHEMGHCLGVAHSAFCDDPPVAGCTSTNMGTHRFDTLPDSARDIGVSQTLSTPVAWIISSTASSASNYRVKRWNAGTSSWETEATAAGVRIAVTDDGLPLVVNAGGGALEEEQQSERSGHLVDAVREHLHQGCLGPQRRQPLAYRVHRQRQQLQGREVEPHHVDVG